MNTDGSIFLDEVSQKLRKRLAEIEKDIAGSQKEIESMHDYYWENYTEMDQYGYEDYDNQQALLQEVNANKEKLILKHRFKQMLGNPFFGRVDFLYEGEDEAESFYIGIGNFAERAGMLPLVYDWRAPVSALFYDFDSGPAFYKAPVGVIEGEILSKWQYKIRDGKMIYAFESDMKIDDDILKQELGANGDVRLKNIVRTIQKEQNAIIRNTKDRILVVQGAAGSGKTSVALHRIAYLLYHDRHGLKSSNVLILSPNGVFSDYISHILPELGEENIQEMSFDLFAYRELLDIVSDCEDRYHHLEKEIALAGNRQNILFSEEDKKRSRWKQSKDFVAQTEGFLAVLEDRLMDFKDIEWKGMVRTEEELIRLFYYKFQETPLLRRMDAVRDYFIDEFETLYGRDLTEEEQENLHASFDSMYVTRDIYTIYGWLLEECGYEALPELPYEKRILEYEDVFPMLYLKYRLLGSGSKKQIRHLVIDEMQDYSYLQYIILEGLFSCKMTILGDRAQTMDGGAEDVTEFLPAIFGKNIRKIEIKKSYRNTVEIAEYAAKIAGITEPELFERHGKPVAEEEFSDVEQAVQSVKKHLNIGPEGFETAVVITRSEQEAREVCELLRASQEEVAYIDRDSSTFRKGLTVTTYYLAKGLEFDQVFFIGSKANSPLEVQADYIAATRALHELYMYRPLVH